MPSPLRRPPQARHARRRSGTDSGERRSFRPDIEGLRAVAVAGVLLYHAGVPAFSGGYVGVDVFFVISGFLITGLLVKELTATGTIRLGRFFARRVKRLLPLSLLVVVVVAVLSAVLSDPVQRLAVAKDVAASGLYGMNWWLAAQSTDYSASGLDASPLQHYWTLGVEEQFYVVWPALLLAAALWWRVRGGRIRPALAAAVGGVGVASFVYAERLTAQSADVAYFSTFARGWELALGGLLALVLPTAPRPPRALVPVLAAGGLVAITVSMLVYDEATLFPGATALLPTLGVAALVAAGHWDDSNAASRLLCTGPMRHVGRLSYSWYLWHWPLLVFAGVAWGSLSTVQGLLVVAASYLPTLASHRLLEQPLHVSRARWTRPAVAVPLGVAASGLAVAVALALHTTTPTVPVASKSAAQGARTVPRQPVTQPSAHAVRPDPQAALRDRRPVDRRCLVWQTDTHIPDDCVVGDPAADTTVVLLGDSHALQYAPPLRRIARREGWRLVLLGKAGCPPVDATTFNEALRRPYHECGRWLEKALRRIRDERPKLLVTSANTDYEVAGDDDRPLDRRGSDRALVRGYRRLLGRVPNVDRIAVIAEHPHLGDVPGCVAENREQLDECAMSRDEAMDFEPIGRKAARRVDAARLVDPMRLWCQDDVCPAVIGNVVVYRGDNHLTATYAETMTPWLRKQLTGLIDG